MGKARAGRVVIAVSGGCFSSVSVVVQWEVESYSWPGDQRALAEHQTLLVGELGLGVGVCFLSRTF